MQLFILNSAKAYLDGCNKLGLPDDTYLGYLLGKSFNYCRDKIWNTKK